MSWTTGDTAPDLTGSADVDVTGATVEVHLREPDGSLLVKAATVTDAATGAWSLSWEAGDLGLAGVWQYEVRVTDSSGSVRTFGPDRMVVREAFTGTGPTAGADPILDGGTL